MFLPDPRRNAALSATMLRNPAAVNTHYHMNEYHGRQPCRESLTSGMIFIRV
jgi:hypothetical protein